MNRIVLALACAVAGCAASDGSLPDQPDARRGDAAVADAPAADAAAGGDDAPATADAAGASGADAEPSDAGPPAAVINEFVANHSGTDTMEYIEIRGQPSTDYSGLTILAIEGDWQSTMTTARGVIDAVFPVGSTGPGGYWDTGYLAQDSLENGSLTLLLVAGFSGSAGDDIDTNDDGTIDSAPWTNLYDGIAVDDAGSGDLPYAVALTPGFDGGSLTVGGASRIPDGTDTDSPSDWRRNDFDFTPVTGEAENTRGAANALVP